ncbi:MAG: TerC family protein [Calditrichaeota bacterium]|nr:MAG: TerC family protein [Calditrichota bacterium]
MLNSVLMWGAFAGIIGLMLALDLGVFHRRPHAVSIGEALLWSGIWIATGLLFNLGIYLFMGVEPALQFLAGYLIEKSLSVDNIFVFMVIFSYFNVPGEYQHRVLFWGILGALVTRGVLITAGITVIRYFHWAIFIFGGFLIFTAWKMWRSHDRKVDLDRNPVLNLLQRYVPVISLYRGENFFFTKMGRRFATPLFVVLVLIESTDVIFALDSIPAILSITTDPFIVFTSNIFAVLGLRALYFALAGMMRMFTYLHYGLSLILAFVGAKMLLADIYPIPVEIALGVIGGILVISVMASLLFPAEKPGTHSLPDQSREQVSSLEE